VGDNLREGVGTARHRCWAILEFTFVSTLDAAATMEHDGVMAETLVILIEQGAA